eukprot:scaffold106646_cov31-Tisochrysis_lutea.AAC.3
MPLAKSESGFIIFTILRRYAIPACAFATRKRNHCVWPRVLTSQASTSELADSKSASKRNEDSSAPEWGEHPSAGWESKTTRGKRLQPN